MLFGYNAASLRRGRLEQYCKFKTRVGMVAKDESSLLHISTSQKHSGSTFGIEFVADFGKNILNNFPVLIMPLLQTLFVSSFVSRKSNNQTQITNQNENKMLIIMHFDYLFKETFIL